MSRDDAKRALETIKTIQNDKPDEYSDALCTTVIERLMKRAVTDYKQLLKDHQQNKKEYWTMIYNNGKDMSSSKDSEGSATRFMTELREENPCNFDEAYVTKVREVMDNE